MANAFAAVTALDDEPSASDGDDCDDDDADDGNADGIAAPLSQLGAVRAAQAEKFRQHKSNASPKPKARKAKKRKKKKKAKDPKPSSESLKAALTSSGPAIDDDMEYLDAILDASKKCAKRGCKTSVQTLGLVCRYCSMKFCCAHIKVKRTGVQ